MKKKYPAPRLIEMTITQQTLLSGSGPSVGISGDEKDPAYADSRGLYVFSDDDDDDDD